MITFIISMLIAFAWLGYETDWLRVRLLAGTPCVIKYASYEVYNMLKKRNPKWSDTTLHTGNNFPEEHTQNGEPQYIVILTPGIDGVLCGWDWLDHHVADLVDYQPKVDMTIGNINYHMTIKQPAIIKDIMRVNKLTKKQKLAYS